MKFKNLFAFILVIIIGLFIGIRSTTINTVDNTLKKGTSFYVPEKVDFCSEVAPLEIADVRERFDREVLVNANLHASTLLIIKRANRIFPMIEPILENYKIPADFKYVAVIESALINAVSPAGARGIWQFMPETAKEKGMEVNEFIDERYHLEKSTHAACKYFLAAKNKFGNWTMAAASYNAGMSGIQKQMDFQKENNYYDLLLNEETSRYIFRILALKSIMENPKDFGFDISTQNLYPVMSTRKVVVDSTITDLVAFARKERTNYKTLKNLNPWLRERKLQALSGKQYILELPL